MVNYRRKKIPFYKEKAFVWSILAVLGTGFLIWLQLSPSGEANKANDHSNIKEKGLPKSVVVKFPPDFPRISNKLSQMEEMYKPKGKKVRNLVPFPMTAGHLGRITDFIFIDKGEKLLSASTDGTLMLWDIRDLNFPRLESTTMFLTSIDQIAINPDERFMAVYAGSLRFFNLNKDCAYTNINEEKMPITAMSFSRKGRYLAFSTLHNVLHVYDLENLKLHTKGKLRLEHNSVRKSVLILESHESKITALDFSNNRLAAAFEDGTILLYDMKKDFEKVVEITEHEGGVTSLCFSHDGKHLLSSGEDKYILQFDAEGKYVREFAELSSLPLSMTFSQDDRYVFVGCKAGNSNTTTALYQYPGGEIVNEMNEHSDQVSAMAVTSRQGNPLFVTGGCMNNDIFFWDQEGNVVGRINKSGDPVVAVGVTKKKDIAFNLSDQPNIENSEDQFDFQFKSNAFLLQPNFDRLDVTQEIHEQKKYSLKLIENFEPEFNVLHPRQALGLYKGGALESLMLKGDLNGNCFTCYTFVGDKFVVVGGQNGKMEVFSLKGEHLGHMVGHKGDILDLAPSADGKMLVSASADRSVILWDFSQINPDKIPGRKKLFEQLRYFYGFSKEDAKKINASLSEYFSRDAIGWRAITNYLSPPSRTNAPMATVMIQNGDWLAWTPDGYYCAGSREVLDSFGGFLKQQYFSSDALYDYYFNDNMVRLSVANHRKYRGNLPNSSARNEVLLSSYLKAPKVTIISPNEGQGINGDEVEAIVRIEDQGGGIGDIRLFLNGKLFASEGVLQLTRDQAEFYANVDSILPQDDNGISEISEGVLEMRCPVRLIAGVNEISCQANNKKNSVSSSMRAVNVQVDTIVEASNLYVLAIGIQYFKDRKSNLRYTHRDANTMADLFENMGNVGYDDIIVTRLLDPGKEKINQTIKDLKGRMTLYDTFFCHVSSHGLTKKNTYAFLTADFNGKDDWDVMVTIDEMMEFSKNIPALKQVFVLDTCHAGSVTAGYRDVYEKRVSRFSKGSGIHIISASAPRKVALEGYQGHGYFSFFLLDALRGRCDENSDGSITISEIIIYTARKLYEKTRGYQLPELSWSGRNFSLITYKKESVTYK